jgi:hypothetical protein
MKLYIYDPTHMYVIKKSMPLTGRGGPYGSEMSRLPDILDKRLSVGGVVVSLTQQPPPPPGKMPGTHFC